jgi:hypothetical protein
MNALNPEEKRRLIKLRLVKRAERRLKATLGYLIAAVRIVVTGWPEDKAREIFNHELFNQRVKADSEGRDRHRSERSASRTQGEGKDRGGPESRDLEGPSRR